MPKEALMQQIWCHHCGRLITTVEYAYTDLNVFWCKECCMIDKQLLVDNGIWGEDDQHMLDYQPYTRWILDRPNMTDRAKRAEALLPLPSVCPQCRRVHG
jgi:hypothetical protein